MNINFMDDGDIEIKHNGIIFKQDHNNNEIYIYNYYELAWDKPSCLKFSFETQKLEDSFNIKISTFPQNEDLDISIPEKYTVKINSDEEIIIQHLHVSLNNKNQILGKIVNNSFIKTKNFFLAEKIKFINKGRIDFLNPIKLILKNCCLQNNGSIFFEEETTIIHKDSIKVTDKYLPFLYSEPKYGLINNDMIIAKGVLFLFCPFYISETGIIHSYEQIIYKLVNSQFPSCKKYNSYFKELESSKILEEDKNYPIIDIVRVPEELTKKIDNLGVLGEEMSMLFYKKFMQKCSFSYKANNQGNGIDVIAYNSETPEKLIIHESKTYSSNKFELNNNQMTKMWVHYYLFKTYQTCIEKICHEKQTNIKALFIDEVKKFLEYTLNENNKDLLLYLDNFTIGNNQFNPQYQNDIRKILGEDLQESVIEINNNLKKELQRIDNDKRIKKPETKEKKVAEAHEKVEENKCKLGVSYFRDDLTIILRGSSIIHCSIPKKTDLGFNIGKDFTLPTYFIRHRLDTRYAEIGEVPKN